ncbi:MAG: NINE protein [Burkholderiales bacterium]|nr:NINE protein [Burkholderiales bacterium]MDE2564689.1 NINE protein [Burkholderiales bacterium]
MPTVLPARSKALAAWLAVALGWLGVHRFYLRGPGDRLGWLFPLPSLLGLWGLWRVRELGQDDRLAWLLVPMLGLTVTVAMLSAIVYALTPDERWDERWRAGAAQPTRTGWGAVGAAVVALLLGGGVLMATLAYGGTRLFEWQTNASAD